MFKKGLLALTLVFSLPVFAAEHWIDVRVPEQYQQARSGGHQYSLEGSERAHCHRRSG